MNIEQIKSQVLDTMLEMLKPNNTLTTLELKLELKNKGINLNQEAVSKFMSARADAGLLSYTDNGTYRTYSLIKKQYSLANLDKHLFELFEKREYINSKILKLKVIVEDKVSLPNSTIVDYLNDKVKEGVLTITTSDSNVRYSLVKQKQTTTMKDNVEVKVEYLNKTSLIETLKNNKGKRLTIVFTTKDKELRTYNGMFTGHVTNLGWYQFRLRNDSEGNKVYKQFDAKNLLEVRVNKVIYKLKEVDSNKANKVNTYRHNLAIRKGSYSLEDLVLEKSHNVSGKEVIESSKVLELLKLVRVETLYEVANKSVEVFKHLDDRNIKKAILNLSHKNIEI